MIHHITAIFFSLVCLTAAAQLPQQQDIALRLDASAANAKPGAAITQWHGSGPLRKMITSAVGLAPKLKTADWSHKPVLDFDGVDDRLTCQLSKMANYTVIAVFAHDFEPGDDGGALWTANDGAIGQCFIPFTSDEMYSIYKTWRNVSGASPFRRGIPYICTLEVSTQKGQRIKLFCNNTLVRNCWARSMPGGAFRIGSDQRSFFRGQLAELIVYKRILTDIERTQIAAELTDKWLKPTIAVHGPLVVPTANSTTCITAAVLKAQLGSRNDNALKYTLITAPQHGKLILRGKPISANAAWTQDDIRSLRLSYRHEDAQQPRDSFRFRVTAIKTDSAATADLPIQIHPVIAMPTQSHTSPVSIEGDCLGITSVKVGTQTGTILSSQHFYINAPLSPKPSSLLINRGKTNVVIPVTTKWKPLDMMKTRTFHARRGETLLVKADATQIFTADGRTRQTIKTVPGKAVPIALSRPGMMTLRAMRENREVAKLLVYVVAADFLGPISCLPAFARHKRVVVHGDPGQRVVFEGCNRNRVIIERAERDGNYVDLRIRLRTPFPGRVLARLGQGGPVIATCKVEPFVAETRSKYFIGVVDSFPTGESISRGTLTLYPRNPRIDVLFTLNRRSMATIDGSPYLLIPGFLYRPGIPGTIRFMGGDLGKGGGFPYGYRAFENGELVSPDD